MIECFLTRLTPNLEGILPQENNQIRNKPEKVGPAVVAMQPFDVQMMSSIRRSGFACRDRYHFIGMRGDHRDKENNQQKNTRLTDFL